jgi:signal transduction histidine kinase
MISDRLSFPKGVTRGRLLRLLQLAALLAALLVVLLFLRHSLNTNATSFRQDFERQSFIELSRGETFLIARKLAALAKGAQLNCVTAAKRGIVFFEEKKGSCKPGFFRSVQEVAEPNQEIEISFTIRLQDELFQGFLIFLVLQLGLGAATFAVQRQSILVEHQRDLDLAALARQVGHDIRSPLAVLRSSHGGEGVGAKALERLAELVDHLLGSAKPQAPAAKVEELLGDAVEEKRTEFKLEIPCKVDESLQGRVLPGEPFQWRRVLSNLLNNAVEAASEGAPRVEVRAREIEDGWCVEVQDKGRGVPVQILPQLGQRGFSFGKGRGSGLGLASAREFAESLGGRLEIESREREGTVVRLSFPREEAVLVDDDAQLAALWRKVAEKKGVGFRHFASPEEFLKAEVGVPKHATVYLDLEFPGSQDPLGFGRRLARRGYRVVLATGHPAEKLQGLAWLSGVRGKEPPWI